LKNVLIEKTLMVTWQKVVLYSPYTQCLSFIYSLFTLAVS